MNVALPLTEGCFINDKVFLPSDDLSLIGILNTTHLLLLWFCVRSAWGSKSVIWGRAQYVDRYPIPKNLSNWDKKPAVEKLVDQMLSSTSSCLPPRPTTKTALQRQIDATDRQIDQLVYELYGLSQDEIKIIEGAAWQGMST
jgi:hypothetical protein